MAVKMVIAVRRDLNMRKGKMCAQVGHASMKFLIEGNESTNINEINTILSPEETEWIRGSMTKIVVGVDSEDELRQLMLRAQIRDMTVHAITDLGLTEFDGVSTLTCAAFGPHDESAFDSLTNHLKLL